MITNKNNVLLMTQKFQNMALLNSSSSIPQQQQHLTHNAAPNGTNLQNNSPTAQHDYPLPLTRSQQHSSQYQLQSSVRNSIQNLNCLSNSMQNSVQNLNTIPNSVPNSGPESCDLSAPVPTPRDNSTTHLYQNQPILSRRTYDKPQKENKQMNSEFREKQSQLSEVLLLDIERLLEDRESADVVFLLGNEPDEITVYAHMAILRAR